MPNRQDETAWPGGSTGRGYLLVLAAVLVVGALAVVFVTADLLYLRLAVLAGGCAFVLAAMVAAHRRREQTVAAGRMADLRRDFRRELDREEAAHRQAEQQLENDLRREAEESMRAQLATLRAEVASLNDLRQDMARVTALREELAAVAAFRQDLAALASLRGDVAALTALREDVGQLAELRADMGRLRAELTEQLNGEMLVERIVMRTQATRMTVDQAPDGGPRTVESRAFGAGSRPATGASWEAEPPRELTGGWPAVRLDDPLGRSGEGVTREYEHVPADCAGEPATRTPLEWLADRGTAPEASPHKPHRHAAAEPTVARPATPANARPAAPANARPAAPANARPAAPANPAPVNAAPGAGAPPTGAAEDVATPREWLAARSLVDPPLPPVPPRRRRTDGPAPVVDPAEALTTEGLRIGAEHPSLPLWQDADHVRAESRPAPPTPGPKSGPKPSPRPTPRPFPQPSPGPVTGPAVTGPGEPEPAGHARLAEILAESGATPPPGGRRRRRYREEGEPDDVLARVLGGGVDGR